MPIPTPRKRKPDPNQGAIPGFNLGGSATAPSKSSPTGPSGPASAPASSGAAPSAASAYAAADSALNGPPQPTPGGLNARNLGTPTASPSGPLGGGQNLGTSSAASSAPPMSAGGLGRTQPIQMGGLGGPPPPPDYSHLPNPPNDAGAPQWQQRIGRALNGGGLAAMGPAGAYADLGLRGAKAMLKANPYQNPDSWRAAHASPEGQSAFMGRGVSTPGLYAPQTQKLYAQPSRGGGKAGTTTSMFPDEYKDTFPDADTAYHASGSSSAYHGMAAPGSMNASQGLSAPAAASDYMFASRTSGTGNVWFNSHQAATNGSSAPPVASIKAPDDN
jgi:hypothetical protein